MNRSEAKEEELYHFTELARGFKDKNAIVGAETWQRAAREPFPAVELARDTGDRATQERPMAGTAITALPHLEMGGTALSAHLHSPSQKVGAHWHPRKPLHLSSGI